MFLSVEVFDDSLEHEPGVAKTEKTGDRGDTPFDLGCGSRRKSTFAHGFSQTTVNLFERPSNGFRNRVKNFDGMPAASGYLSDSGPHGACTDDPNHCIRRDRLFGRELGSGECFEHAPGVRVRTRLRRRPRPRKAVKAGRGSGTFESVSVVQEGERSRPRDPSLLGVFLMEVEDPPL